MDKRIGAQYYSVRDHITTIEDFDVTCKKISDMGYKIVQISGTVLAPQPMREVVDKYGLKVVTTHKGFGDFQKRLDEVIEYNKILGSDLCGVGAMPQDYAKSDEKLSEFIDEVNQICEVLKKEGMYFGYHNHELEFVKHGDKTVFERLVEETDPEVFNFIADTFWIQMGGMTPEKVIRQLGKRAMAVHFKDFAVDINNWEVPIMCEVGRGNLDWNAIIEACEDAGTRWALVEQDKLWIDNDPFKALSVSYDFLREKGFN